MRAENAYHGLSEMEGSESDASDTDEENFNSYYFYCNNHLASNTLMHRISEYHPFHSKASALRFHTNKQSETTCKNGLGLGHREASERRIRDTMHVWKGLHRRDQETPAS